MKNPPRRVGRMARAGDWPTDKTVGTVSLDFDSRHRRRIRMSCDDGTNLLLDLEKATALLDGDGLATDDGSWIAVRAAPEELIEVTCKCAHELHRIAWHLGNRHCPAAIETDRILIRRDHVIEGMLIGLGAQVRGVKQSFDPEKGAYGDHGTGNGEKHE